MKKCTSVIFAVLLTLAAVNLSAYNDNIEPRVQVAVDPALEPFYHGVASGDPLADRVIIWTRVTPDSTVSGPVIVSWRIALDTGMMQTVQAGSLITSASADYTVKVDVTGLQPATTYYYEFTALSKNSQRGKTRTAPQNMLDSLRFAVVSCANYEAGFFNVYRCIAERADIDAVLALGDYIYEYESGGYSPNPNAPRYWDPATEILTVTDYRMRYSTYHLDPDLRMLHQQFAWIAVWDDHESANDSWYGGAENHTSPAEGVWGVRKAAAIQAYFEWMPIRVPDPNDPQRVFRSIRYGSLVEFEVLDTRLCGRDMQDGTTNANVMSSSRQLLGTTQFGWLQNRLDSGSAQWKVLAQQVMMAPLEIFGYPVNGDQWDGYPAERDRVYNHILNNNIHDVVVITGDIHSSWGNDLPTASYNPSNGAGSAGVEFVTPSVTSPGFPLAWGAPAIQAANGHIKYCNLDLHGFIILDINQQRAQSDWYYVSTIDSSSSSFSYGDSWYVDHLSRHLEHAPGAAVPRTALANEVPAPYGPRPILITSVGAPQHPLTVMGIYPNPATTNAEITFVLNEPADVSLSILNVNGQAIDQQLLGTRSGMCKEHLSLELLAPGLYFVKVTADGDEQVLRLVVE
jgi:alkaline phosphatase D